MQPGSFLVSGDTMKYSPHSIEPWVVRIAGRCWSSANLCLLTFQRWVKESGNPAPKLAYRWKSAVWLDKINLTDEHLVRTDERVVYARSVRRLAEHSWSEENLRAVVETPQRPQTTIADLARAAEPIALPHEAPEAGEDAKEQRS